LRLGFKHEAKDKELWDQQLWKGVEGICRKMPYLPKAGSDSLKKEREVLLMEEIRPAS